jgi:hypothetical protein
MGGQEMQFIRTAPDSGQRLYQCPPGGCRRRGRVKGCAACGDRSWEDPAQDIRLFGGRIRRGSPEWREKYRKRWSIERIFSGRKCPGRPERHCCLGLAKARMRTLSQTTTTQAEAVAKAKCGKRPLQESPPAMALAA